MNEARGSAIRVDRQPGQIAKEGKRMLFSYTKTGSPGHYPRRLFFSYAIPFVASLLWGPPICAQQAKYITENGMTYLEMPVRVQRPVREDKVESYQVTTYKPQVKTDVRQVPRYYYEPTYSSVWVPRVHGWARILQEPTVTWELEPRYHWQLRVQNVPTSVARTEWIPQTQIVQVPVTRLRLEEKLETQRVAVVAPPTYLPPANPYLMPPAQPGPLYIPAQPNSGFGGIAAMESDPPRVGAATEGLWMQRR